jgi:hypothetical protein
MPLPPFSSVAPRPEHIFMPGISYQIEAPSTTASAGPTPSPLPLRLAPETSNPSHSSSGPTDHEDTLPKPFPVPKLRLEVRDLNHTGSGIFLHAVNAASTFAHCVQSVLKELYVSPSHPHYRPPPTRSVTLVLRNMGGVAYTTGSDLDNDHKEIHFNLGYIAGLSKERQTAEITGVLTHELVHCYQHTGYGSCPGGLVEGIADWVRLRCDLAPPHWNRKETGGKWDGGYQHTAYFLAYLERRFGHETVRKLNESLRTTRYEEKAFWTGQLGRPVQLLWEDYKEELEKKNVNVVEHDKDKRDGDEASETTQA